MVERFKSLMKQLQANIRLFKKIQKRRARNWIERSPDRRTKVSTFHKITHLFLFNLILWGVTVHGYQTLFPGEITMVNPALAVGIISQTEAVSVTVTNAENPVEAGSVTHLIHSKFPEDPEVLEAIFKAESNLVTDAMGWNCLYNGKSQACKPEDRHKAWSVDCGLAQINVPGRVCPEELFDPEHNLKVARKLYDSKTSLKHWSAYKNESFKKFLE